MRQPHSPKAGPVATATMLKTPMPRMLPMGEPAVTKAPKKDLRPRGACSVTMRKAPDCSPPMKKPCSTRSPTSRIGAKTPTVA